jgi:molybdenum cofactor biosynthesis enzyme MoaA
MEKETKIQTFSLIAGSESCNARCPFCVSKMTPNRGITQNVQSIDWNRFNLAFEYAKNGEVQTAMITGKGEPTLFPDQIYGYLEHLLQEEATQSYKIPSKELQTNGIVFEKRKIENESRIREWKKLGLDTIAISVVHFEPEKNRQIYLPYSNSYINLADLMQNLNDYGLKTRLALIMVKGFIDTPDAVGEFLDFAKKNNCEQITIRPVNKPENPTNQSVYSWTANHQIDPDQLLNIQNYLEANSMLIKVFSFGGKLYDYQGMTVCFTNSLTKDVDDKNMRQLIFYPNGTIATDWTKEAKLL